ncbi:MAG: S41 family peptidase [bacterium]|nr:S41 family peptidase [bacterium]
MFYKQKTNFIKRFTVVYLLLAVLMVSFLGGALFGFKNGKQARIKAGGDVLNQKKLPPYLLQNTDFSLFWDVWKMTKEKYLEQPVADTRLFYGSLAGIVASLGDPYSNFFDPEVTKKFNGELAGTFEGIGAEIGVKKDQLLIVAPLPDTPAQKAGLRAGDRILGIDNRDTAGMPVDYAVSLIRGKKGTSVVLKVLHNGQSEAKDVTITRDEIHIDSVTWKMMDDDIAYVKLVQFNGETSAKFEQAAREIILKNPKGVILDLRNNPGGYFDAAIAVASYWILPSQVVAIQKSQGNKEDEFYSRSQAILKDFPTIVLVNGGSASASEIVAGALQDYGRVKLLGEKTFGKGLVQDYEMLPGGSSIKITVAEWLTPNGRYINKEGIAPDVEVKLSKADYEADKDPQLDKAVKMLKK